MSKSEIFLFILCIIACIGLIFSGCQRQELKETNEFKKELIYTYEEYLNASEAIIQYNVKDSTKYYKALEKLDSLYKTQL